MSKLVDKSTLMSLYYSLIYPYFTYCHEVWGLAPASHRKKLITLQKRAVRIIAFSERFEHTDPLFKDLRILKFSHLNYYLVANFMFKVYRRDVPFYFQDMFTLNSSVHDHFTRQSSHLHIPIPLINLTKMSIKYVGVIIWNEVSRSMYLDCSIFTFRKNLKRMIIDDY